MTTKREQTRSTESKPRVLLVHPEVEPIRDLAEGLGRNGFDPRLVLSPEAATIAAAHHRPAVVVLHGSFLDETARHVIEALRLTAPQTPLLAWVDGGDEQLRLRALLLGAEDCLVDPFAVEEAVIRIRRAVERRDGLRRLAVENQAARERAEGVVAEVRGLRDRLQRLQLLLKRGVEFEQRIDAAAEADDVARRLLRTVSVEMHVERLAFLRPGEVDEGFVAVATWGLDPRLEVPFVPAGGELARALAASGAPAVFERLAAVPGLRGDVGPLAAAGFAAAVPLLRAGELAGIILVGEVREGGAPASELLLMVHYLAAPLAPLFGVLDAHARKSCA